MGTTANLPPFLCHGLLYQPPYDYGNLRITTDRELLLYGIFNDDSDDNQIIHYRMDVVGM